MGTGILLCGLNGAGKSTLGRVLAEKLRARYIDNEDLYFFGPPEYKYENVRSHREVERLLVEEIEKSGDFVFTAVRGSFPAALPFFTHAVLVETPRDVRLSRVRERSLRRFGERVLPGGDLYRRERDFYDLAASRPEDFAETWLRSFPGPAIRVDGACPPEENAALIMERFGLK